MNMENDDEDEVLIRIFNGNLIANFINKFI